MADYTPQDLPEEVAEPSKFTVRQQKFIVAFCASGNCTLAAKEAGYSAEYAYCIGSRLSKNAEIRAEIDRRLADMALPALAVTKLIGDIAQSNLNEFLTIYEDTEPTKIQQPLGEAIAQYREQIAFEAEYAALAALEGKELGSHLAEQQRRERQIIRWQLELKANPAATREIAGEPKVVKRTRLDLVRLAEAKENGRIKSLAFTEFGPKVEFYPADAALDKLARMHGLYEKDNRQLSGAEVIIVGGGSDETADTA